MGSYTSASCTLTGLMANTEYEIIVSTVYSDSAAHPYNYNAASFTTDDVNISRYINIVNSIDTGEKSVKLTDLQLDAIEKVLAYDNGK